MTGKKAPSGTQAVIRAVGLLKTFSRNRPEQTLAELARTQTGERVLLRGLSAEDAVNLIVNGFCREVFRELPMEFAVEAQKLLGVSLEGSVG